MKNYCVGCENKLCATKTDYETRGNWCRICEVKASVTVKPDITWFINLARVAQIYEKA